MDPQWVLTQAELYVDLHLLDLCKDLQRLKKGETAGEYLSMLQKILVPLNTSCLPLAQNLVESAAVNFVVNSGG